MKNDVANPSNAQDVAIAFTNDFPEITGQRKEDLAAAFSAAIEWGRKDATKSKDGYVEKCDHQIVQAEPEIQSPIPHDLILLQSVNYFGRIIKRGSTFKQRYDSKDEYILWENSGGILMHCPAIKIHFSTVREDYFVKQWE